ncbi:MAG: zinc ribbon domain-containing protein [Coriobacteriales bacterium]|nr:zinc ribbon domain-containing protein [Coriobacteriales bacterium]
MSEIISQLFSLPVRIAFAIVCIILIFIYLLAIYWVHNDAKERGANAKVWTIIAIIPIAGLIAYCLLRPKFTYAEQDEINRDMELTSRQLRNYGNCSKCSYPIERNYIVCPSCGSKLRNVCNHCGYILEPDWAFCPACANAVYDIQGGTQAYGSAKVGDYADENAHFDDTQNFAAQTNDNSSNARSSKKPSRNKQSTNSTYKKAQSRSHRNTQNTNKNKS